MLYEICDKGSFGNDSRYTLCDRKNDERRRYLFNPKMYLMMHSLLCFYIFI